MEVAGTAYRVHLSQFEGPLDLLLHLVRDAKLDITEISLAQVAQQYFSYLESMQQLDVELESSYLVVFAQLLELKSRLLLPYDEEEEEESGTEEWSGEEGEGGEPSLVKKLSEYARIKEVAEWMSRREDACSACYPRPLPMLSQEPPELEVSLSSLVRSMRRLERTTRAPRAAVAVAKIALSVPERIEQLWELLTHRPLTQLSEVLGNHPSRDLIIVTFLALLEMAKTRKITVSQEITVGDIRIQKVQDDEGKLA